MEVAQRQCKSVEDVQPIVRDQLHASAGAFGSHLCGLPLKRTIVVPIETVLESSSVDAM